MNGERDFDSVGAVTAQSYDVLVDAEHEGKAELLLSQRHGLQAPAPPPRGARAPMRCYKPPEG